MKTLEEIKDDYIRDKFLASQELDTWVAFQNYFASMHPEWFEQHWEEIAKRYALEVANQVLKNASDKTVKEYVRPRTLNYDEISDLIL